MKKMPLIVLAISAKGVKFIDGDSKVSFVSLVHEMLEIFTSIVLLRCLFKSMIFELYRTVLKTVKISGHLHTSTKTT